MKQSIESSEVNWLGLPGIHINETPIDVIYLYSRSYEFFTIENVPLVHNFFVLQSPLTPRENSNQYARYYLIAYIPVAVSPKDLVSLSAPSLCEVQNIIVLVQYIIVAAQ